MININQVNKNFNPKVKISELRIEILDKKSNRMSRVILSMFEHSELAEITANS